MDNKKVNDFIKTISEAGYNIQENIILKEYTSLKIGGQARLLSEPHTIDEISLIINTAQQMGIPYYVIGNGTNILIDDDGIDALIIVMKTNFTKISKLDDYSIKAQAGVSLANLCQFACQHSLSGLEFAWGIPASVGGATYMNAGAYGGEIKDVLTSCTYLDEDGTIKELANKDLKFEYRQSLFSNSQVVVLEAEFKLVDAKQEAIQRRMDELLDKRKSKQPLEYPSAGSTFKRPPGNYASALIEQSGLKGFTKGNVMVSDKHAGFLLNHNNGTSKEFLALVDHVREVVKTKTGYDLECEIKFLKNK